MLGVGTYERNSNEETYLYLQVFSTSRDIFKGKSPARFRFFGEQCNGMTDVVAYACSEP